jgi:hypothetical protein
MDMIAAHSARRAVFAALGLDFIPEPLAPVYAPAPVPPRPFIGCYEDTLDVLRRRRRNLEDI